MSGLDQHVVAASLVFARVGGCLGFAPGFSSPRIPVRVRVLVAVGVAIPVYGSLSDRLAPLVADAPARRALWLILSELAIGLLLGLVARLLMAALETMATAASMAANLTSSFAPRPDESETIPELAAFISVMATFFLFLTDAHWIVIQTLAESFDAFPVGAAIDGRFALARVVDTLGYGFRLSLGVAAPFIVFGLLVNFSFGLINKVAPQISVYFVSVPFTILGSLMLLLAVLGSSLTMFADGYADWLSRQ